MAHVGCCVLCCVCVVVQEFSYHTGSNTILAKSKWPTFCRFIEFAPKHPKYKWMCKLVIIQIGGPLEKLSNFVLLPTSFLVLDHVYVCYKTSHVRVCCKNLPTAKVMGCNVGIRCF